ncbi:2-keto-4-pentenoate hydratase [Acidisarcina polymorpha]|uniref:2-keto-4-pentenoate hydratase n=1 Tax=Acidisarcina polymorpha TaxID=2211140 RepID=A0A2Z5FV86_9BACT|nr:2-keto-4-pentenoate hydratase [Acidisarcina polymorpha]AXC10771.1 2-keto-4-pentenoate hydratase [Acidisarcina polymorpha]
MSTPSYSNDSAAQAVADRQIDPLNDDKLRQAAELLLRARREREPISELPAGLRPTTLGEAYRLQEIMISTLGPVGGWKVGAPSPDAVPLCAPMPLLGGFGQSNVTIGASFSRFRGVEAEIAFRLRSDLPLRERPYSREEVVAAIAGAHPAIEILEAAFLDPDSADRLSVIGDLQSHGGFVHGAALPDWRDVDFAHESVIMIVDGVVRIESRASNLAGVDLLRLVTWLANEGQPRTGGLKAGDWITTGSWTGKVLASAGSEAIARFSTFGDVVVRFADEE